MDITPEVSNLVGMAFLAGCVFASVGAWVFGFVADVIVALISRRKGADVEAGR